ncbi:hypothetical protein [Mycobacterium sp. IS-1742]|uniref:hypothetical protein n=1 Tax=Mycobacterium sp. IS-1742 TaxID=1772285 RepID=UPI0012FBC079|nr:hypothetical protein [Mycobacterium sp. IS-1742]
MTAIVTRDITVNFEETVIVVHNFEVACAVSAGARTTEKAASEYSETASQLQELGRADRVVFQDIGIPPRNPTNAGKPTSPTGASKTAPEIEILCWLDDC